MIINENICNIEDIINPKRYSAANFVAIYIDQLNLTDGESYTISLDCEQTGDKTDGFTFNLYNYNLKKLINQVGVFNKRNHMTFKYEEGETYKVNLYTGIIGEYTESGANFYNIKLEEGDQMTPYLPHKSKVKSDNQAIFPIGGGYHEVLPI